MHHLDYEECLYCGETIALLPVSQTWVHAEDTLRECPNDEQRFATPSDPTMTERCEMRYCNEPKRGLLRYSRSGITVHMNLCAEHADEVIAVSFERGDFTGAFAAEDNPTEDLPDD